MHRSWGLLAASVASLALVAGCSSSGAGPTVAEPTQTTTSSPSATSTGPVLAVDSTSRLVRPKSFSLGDFGAPAMKKVTWATWSPTTAVGTGQYEQFLCVPSCDSPQVIKTPARVTLTKVKNGKYTRMKFTSLSSTKIDGTAYSFNGRVWG